MVGVGNIILVPKGTPVVFGEDWDRRERVTRRDHITVADYVYPAAMQTTGEGKVTGPEVSYLVSGDKTRFVPADKVLVLEGGDHRLHVSPRRIVGGSPIRGGGMVYSTPGKCACGERFERMPNAREVRDSHRWHVIAIGERALRAAEEL
jgi:hypothetical protein